MKQFAERAKAFKVPERYELRSGDAMHLILTASEGGFDGMFDAIRIAYKMGFQKGCNYQKRQKK